MDKYKEVIKEIPLYFCVKCENFEFSTHFEKIISSLFLGIQTSVIHQMKGDCVVYNWSIIQEALTLISKEP